MPQAIASDHRYLQIARTLRKEIVDGVYPVGSQLPTEHQLCERFAVSRYTVREALRRLREDNLVASRPRAGTRVVPRPATSSYAQDAMSIDDLLAFAAGAQLTIESNEMVTIDDGDSPLGPDCRPALSGCRCAVTVKPTARRCPCAERSTTSAARFAAVGRLLHRHTGPIFPLIEDLFGVSIAELHQEIAAVLLSPELADGLGVEAGTAALQMQRTYKTSEGEVAQVTINTHLSSSFRYAMTMRRVNG